MLEGPLWEDGELDLPCIINLIAELTYTTSGRSCLCSKTFLLAMAEECQSGDAESRM